MRESRTISAVKRAYRRNPIREARIRKTQRTLLLERFRPDSKKLIVILTPGVDVVNGGILSIASIYKETLKLGSIHQSETVLCTVPGEPLLLRYTKFKNDNNLFEFSEVLRYFSGLSALLIHIPEYCCGRFLEALSEEDKKNLSRIEDIHINIMLQNFRLLPPKATLSSMASLGRLTCTTAHARYSTQEKRAELGIPLHKLSVWNSPELYERVPYASKRNLMIVSNDPNPNRDRVMRTVTEGLPSMEIITIRDMPYEKFRQTIASAKWALTFGEGLDGYFVETIFSGGVSFAAYNPTFFTEDFRALRTVYESYDDLRKKICDDITRLDNKKEFTEYQNAQHALCSKYYDRKQYIQNLRLFYEGRYTFP